MLVETWDAEDLDAWGQVVGGLKPRNWGPTSWKRWGKIDGMFIGKKIGGSGVRGMKCYAVGESGWETCAENGVLVCVCVGGGCMCGALRLSGQGMA